MRNDVRVLIGRIAQLKQEVQQAPDGALWEHGLPNLAAEPDRIAAAEAALGVRLDDQHRELLAAADGWPYMFQHIDLFSTTDLAGGPRMAMSREMLLAMGPEPLDEAGAGSDLLPIAATSEDRDLFVMPVSAGRAQREVLWFAGTLVERFADVEDMLLAFISLYEARLGRS
jgi:hypothetical protein